MHKFAKKTCLVMAATMTSMILTACGTTYKAPTEIAPALWQGKYGVKVIGKSIKMTPGVHNGGDVFAEINADNVRTGRLLEDVQYVSGSGITTANKDLVLKAGTPLYARQFTQSITTTRAYVPSKTVTQSARNNPIEWCAVSPYGKGALCMFWQGADQAFYLEDRRSAPLSPTFKFHRVGSKGPMPKIVEDPNVKFDADLKAALVVGPLRKKGTSIFHMIGSAVEGKFLGNVVSSRHVSWDENDEGKVSLWGGEYKLTASREEASEKPTSVQVEVLKEPSVVGAQGISADQMDALIKAILAVQQKK